MISRCSTYLKSRRKQQREPMQPLSPATEAWTRVGTDLFKMQGKDYLLVVDYYTNYPEIPPVVIKHTKSIFARYGHSGSCYIGQRSAICRQGISTLCTNYINDMIFTRYLALELIELHGKVTLENWRRGQCHLISPLCAILGTGDSNAILIGNLHLDNSRLYETPFLAFSKLHYFS